MYASTWQAFLGYYLVYVRSVQALICWHDPHLTAWLAIWYASLCATSHLIGVKGAE